MNVTIDRGGCVSCGACWNTCPEIFGQNPCDSYSEIVEEYRLSLQPGRGDSTGLSWLLCAGSSGSVSRECHPHLLIVLYLTLPVRFYFQIRTTPGRISLEHSSGFSHAVPALFKCDHHSKLTILSRSAGSAMGDRYGPLIFMIAPLKRGRAPNRDKMNIAWVIHLVAKRPSYHFYDFLPWTVCFLKKSSVPCLFVYFFGVEYLFSNHIAVERAVET